MHTEYLLCLLYDFLYVPVLENLMDITRKMRDWSGWLALLVRGSCSDNTLQTMEMKSEHSDCISSVLGESVACDSLVDHVEKVWYLTDISRAITDRLSTMGVHFAVSSNDMLLQR